MSAAHHDPALASPYATRRAVRRARFFGALLTLSVVAHIMRACPLPVAADASPLLVTADPADAIPAPVFVSPPEAAACACPDAPPARIVHVVERCEGASAEMIASGDGPGELPDVLDLEHAPGDDDGALPEADDDGDARHSAWRNKPPPDGGMSGCGFLGCDSLADPVVHASLGLGSLVEARIPGGPKDVGKTPIDFAEALLLSVSIGPRQGLRLHGLGSAAIAPLPGGWEPRIAGVIGPELAFDISDGVRFAANANVGLHWTPRGGGGMATLVPASVSVAIAPSMRVDVGLVMGAFDIAGDGADTALAASDDKSAGDPACATTTASPVGAPTRAGEPGVFVGATLGVAWDQVLR